MTLTTQLVLRALLADPGREMYGREIMQAASLATGTVYPILARLQAEGWISVREETIDKHAEGRPARRYYKLTESGIENAAAAMARASSQLSRLNLDGPTQLAPLNIGGIEIPVITDDRQPPGIVSVASRGGEATEVHSFALAPGPEARACRHKGLKLSKGVCPDCDQWVVKS
jgi:PadR family transcriptional regulator PadR